MYFSTLVLQYQLIHLGSLFTRQAQSISRMKKYSYDILSRETLKTCFPRQTLPTMEPFYVHKISVSETIRELMLNSRSFFVPKFVGPRNVRK